MAFSFIFKWGCLVLITCCQPGSNRQCKLMNSKARQCETASPTVRHHAQSRRQVVEFCQGKDVQMIAVGDVRDIQDCVALGRMANQKISQWPHGQFVQYLVYKARKYGITVEQIPEDYSTRTCSCCGTVKEHAPRGRVYTCPGCGAVIHRDVNGASNICSRIKYGSYGKVQAHTIMYLQPLRRSRALETGLCCLEFPPGTPALKGGGVSVPDRSLQRFLCFVRPKFSEYSCPNISSGCRRVAERLPVCSLIYPNSPVVLINTQIIEVGSKIARFLLP